ncbi:hypothetical protein ACIQ4Z_24225 [Peribacillus asahii]|uniref:hypothetical protein n=1 Tax=Peribacillus asahii TaxID=228899 RepID=UPI00380E87C1
MVRMYLSAEIYMFRNEPNSTTKYALFGCSDESDCNKGHFERAISLAKQLNDGEYLIVLLILLWLKKPLN